MAKDVVMPKVFLQYTDRKTGRKKAQRQKGRAYRERQAKERGASCKAGYGCLREDLRYGVATQRERESV